MGREEQGESRLQARNDVFISGAYHRRFGRKNIHALRQALLRAYYRASSRFIAQLGWPSPLSRPTPHALLCGTASPYTTMSFVRFVQERNCMAEVAVLDISAYSLRQSELAVKACRALDGTRISYVKGDALHMPFADGSFDWIDTDFFLQYFSPDERLRLFQEWYRVLRPGGIVTTRDWVRQKHTFLERVIEYCKNWLIRHMLGAYACSVTLQDVEEALRAIGCKVAMFPLRFALLSIPMMRYIFIQKPL